LVGLREFLRVSPKARFVIDKISQYPRKQRMLEIGCSRGYLTSYFILAGYDVTGVDVSHEAVESARKNFGDYFFLAGSPEIAGRAPYDVIYHTGMIGCVGDPIGLTRDLLEMLSPGGLIVFNAPNAEACWLDGQLWVETAPPPDVVTLFRKGFWKRWFSDQAEVVEKVDSCDPRRALQIFLLRLARRRWRKPIPLPLVNRGLTHLPAVAAKGSLWRRGVGKAGLLLQDITVSTRIARLAPRLPAEFGLYVQMVKK
jgi:SAM-dependent methyltransferase